jgi:DNA polymerase III delta subunit
MSRAVEQLVERLRTAPAEPVYLVTGDTLLAEPLGQRLAAAIAAKIGCQVETYRHPASLAPLLADLRVYSLFATGKVVLVVDSAVLADRAAAADLIDDAAAVLPLAGAQLGPREREAASRLLQAIHLFGDDAGRDAADTLAAVPDWAFQGGRAHKRSRGDRGRTKKQVEELRQALAPLLEGGLAAGLAGWAEGDVAELSTVVASGLPPGHTLVLVESTVAADHPLIARWQAVGAIADAGRLEAERRGGWSGLDMVAAELARETGATIAGDALAELARRTLKRGEGRSGGGLDPTSAGRLAAEYRKLAGLVGAGGRIGLAEVEESVEDRGDEDVWQLLDAVAAGKLGEALGRLRRFVQGAEDPLAARLSFFSLLAGFCRQLTALAGLMKLLGVPPGERSFDRFKTRLAPGLQGEIPGGKNPLAALHPFRLHRAYLAVSRMRPELLVALPWHVLETELELKGESTDADAALSQLIARIAAG